MENLRIRWLLKPQGLRIKPCESFGKLMVAGVPSVDLTAQKGTSFLPQSKSFGLTVPNAVGTIVGASNALKVESSSLVYFFRECGSCLKATDLLIWFYRPYPYPAAKDYNINTHSVSR
mmetsp:Transcript_3599/g.4772  ORF Transcript_3599/g.4772 Transcript_3599/m.4772 type:complete len:118 (+) Transcript_3599:1118-1471(+)